MSYFGCLQVFIVDTRASKRQIKDSVHRLYDIQTKKVNTLIRCVAHDSLSSKQIAMMDGVR